VQLDSMYLERLPDVIKLKEAIGLGLEHIMERFGQGLSPEQIALDFFPVWGCRRLRNTCLLPTQQRH